LGKVAGQYRDALGDQLAPGRGSRRAARIGQQHERQQSRDLGVFRKRERPASAGWLRATRNAAVVRRRSERNGTPEALMLCLAG